MWSVHNRTGRLGFAAASMFGGFMTGTAWLALFVVKFADHQSPEITLLFFLVLGAGSWITLAACIRRLHDVGWSGWWILLAPVPLAGLAQATILAVMPSQRSDNRFGPPPVTHKAAS